jgi:hypothetical protein
MTITVSRRNVLQTTCAVGAAVAGIVPTTGAAQNRSTDGPTDGFLRDDWFGEPWRNPQSVDKVRKYQQAIRDSRLVVLRSDAYHLAVAKPDECVASVLAFIRENA